MPLVVRVAHPRLLLEAVKSSGEIFGQKMVDSGRYEGDRDSEICYGVNANIVTGAAEGCEPMDRG